MNRPYKTTITIFLCLIAGLAIYYSVTASKIKNDTLSRSTVSFSDAVGDNTLMFQLGSEGPTENLLIDGQKNQISPLGLDFLQKETGQLSPDRSRVAYISEKGQIDAPKPELHIYSKVDFQDNVLINEGITSINQPFIWLPDSQSLIVSQEQNINNQSTSTLIRVDVESGQQSTLLTAQALSETIGETVTIIPVRISQDKNNLFISVWYTSSPTIELYVYNFDSKETKAVLKTGEARLYEYPNYNAWLGQTDQALVYDDVNNTVVVKNLITGASFPAPQSNIDYPYSPISPDGRYLVAARFSQDKGNDPLQNLPGTVDFILTDLESHTEKLIIRTRTEEYNANFPITPHSIWSPDSSFLLFPFMDKLYRLDVQPRSLKLVDTGGFQPGYMWFYGWAKGTVIQ